MSDAIAAKGTAASRTNAATAPNTASSAPVSLPISIHMPVANIAITSNLFKSYINTNNITAKRESIPGQVVQVAATIPLPATIAVGVK